MCTTKQDFTIELMLLLPREYSLCVFVRTQISNHFCLFKTFVHLNIIISMSDKQKSYDFYYVYACIESLLLKTFVHYYINKYLHLNYTYIIMYALFSCLITNHQVLVESLLFWKHPAPDTILAPPWLVSPAVGSAGRSVRTNISWVLSALRWYKRTPFMSK